MNAKNKVDLRWCLLELLAHTPFMELRASCYIKVAWNTNAIDSTVKNLANKSSKTQNEMNFSNYLYFI